MVKCFIFDDPVQNEEIILKFIQYFIAYSNYQSIIHTRFQNLIHEFDSTKSLGDPNLNDQSTDKMRKSYQLPTDLQQDLIDAKCDKYICVKSGHAEVIPNKFIVDTYAQN